MIVLFAEEPYKITDDITVLATGGHTLSCVSILVGHNNLCDGVVAIAGDLFESEQDVYDSSIWINAGSEDQSLQFKNRVDIAGRADIIIPGHGRPFAVTENVRHKLKRDLEESVQILKEDKLESY
jgi:glyoxylase-like metal-dependent hydrolase (beta-lactamase superfamily II)